MKEEKLKVVLRNKFIYAGKKTCEDAEFLTVFDDKTQKEFKISKSFIAVIEVLE